MNCELDCYLFLYVKINAFDYFRKQLFFFLCTYCQFFIPHFHSIVVGLLYNTFRFTPK